MRWVPRVRKIKESEIKLKNTEISVRDWTPKGSVTQGEKNLRKQSAKVIPARGKGAAVRHHIQLKWPSFLKNVKGKTLIVEMLRR